VASEAWLQARVRFGGFVGMRRVFGFGCFGWRGHRALEELRRSGRRREDPVGLTAVADRAARDDPAGEAVERLATRRALRLIAGLPAHQAEA